MPQTNPAPGNGPGLISICPVNPIASKLADLRDQLLLLTLIFDQPHAGQKIEDECAARAIHMRLVDMLIQIDTLRATVEATA